MGFPDTKARLSLRMRTNSMGIRTIKAQNPSKKSAKNKDGYVRPG
jgi:hypothetical protein